MNKSELLAYARWCKINKYDPVTDETINMYIRNVMLPDQKQPFGEHYVVINKRIYRLSNDTYNQLVRLEAEKLQSQKACEDFELDPMEAESEVSNFHNFIDWIKQNFAPVSTDADNYDLHRYDIIDFKFNDKIDLPF